MTPTSQPVSAEGAQSLLSPAWPISMWLSHSETGEPGVLGSVGRVEWRGSSAQTHPKRRPRPGYFLRHGFMHAAFIWHHLYAPLRNLADRNRKCLRPLSLWGAVLLLLNKFWKERGRDIRKEVQGILCNERPWVPCM